MSHSTAFPTPPPPASHPRNFQNGTFQHQWRKNHERNFLCTVAVQQLQWRGEKWRKSFNKKFFPLCAWRNFFIFFSSLCCLCHECDKQFAKTYFHRWYRKFMFLFICYVIEKTAINFPARWLCECLELLRAFLNAFCAREVIKSIIHFSAHVSGEEQTMLTVERVREDIWKRFKAWFDWLKSFPLSMSR